MDSQDLWAAVNPEASRRLLIAAVDSFAALGYHGTSTRHIASGAGMSPAALYVHYKTKAELLLQIGLISHRSVLAALHDSVRGMDAPPERLRALVYAFTCWHARHHEAARVTQNELGALDPDAFEQVAALRRETMRLFHEEIRRGVAAGDLDVADIPGTARALTSLGIDVARWYRPTGERAPEEVGALYAHLAARMLGSTLRPVPKQP